MIRLTGFCGPQPYSIILWQKDGEDKSKTVCYSAEEEQAAITRFHTPTDFYHGYDSCRVVYENHFVVVTHLEQQKKGA